MDQNNLPDHPLSDQLHISAAELATRLAFLSFTREDEENLREIAAILRADIELVIDEFYRHLHRFEELRAILSDSALLARLKESQRAYLLSFESASFGVEYAERRLRIGLVHEQIGLAQKWYLGAYRLLSELVSRRLTERYATVDTGWPRSSSLSTRPCCSMKFSWWKTNITFPGSDWNRASKKHRKPTVSSSCSPGSIPSPGYTIAVP